MAELFNVHISHPTELLSILTDRLPDGVRITTGEPPPPDTQILVSGRPDPDFVEASDTLRAVIVPWAGIPETTRDLMLQHPGISVHNLHHNAPQVAEMTLALLLAAAKRIVPMDRSLRKGDWTHRYESVPSVLLRGKTAVVLGFGNIGQHLGVALKGLGMEVVGVRRSTGKGALPGSWDEIHPPGRLTRLLPRANVLAITLPLTDETRGLIGAKALAQMPDGSILVNVGRGPVVDEAALYDALRNGPLGSAGIDVWWNYPSSEEERARTYPANVPLHELDNIVMSPHRSGAVEEVAQQRMHALAEILNAAANGKDLPNRIDLELGY